MRNRVDRCLHLYSIRQKLKRSQGWKQAPGEAAQPGRATGKRGFFIALVTSCMEAPCVFGSQRRWAWLDFSYVCRSTYILKNVASLHGNTSRLASPFHCYVFLPVYICVYVCHIYRHMPQWAARMLPSVGRQRVIFFAREQKLTNSARTGAKLTFRPPYWRLTSSPFPERDSATCVRK